MQIDKVFTDYVSTLSGRILHVGGYMGEEGEFYKEHNIEFTYIEPLQHCAAFMRGRGYNVIEAAIGPSGTFYVAGNNASSILPPLEHELKGEIAVDHKLLSEVEEGYNILVLDVQGASLDVLETGQLSGFDVIICEVSKSPRYVGERTYDEVIEYLLTKGFKLIKKYQHAHYDIYDLVFERKN
jgi:hypothetical protein